ncbi:unnamed protein product [Dovyalis caffra]|uniref:Major facilitator superfamily (MFS) profile domain-containing protein n=1 Tax=Dovyalis caffra TaxID=77055 RepID=A0AAV1RYY1_9ROSI|nr:unnamed protein product [Dovyalis caffra]
MEKESMEEGLADITRPLLLGERDVIKCSKPTGDSSITPLLFLSCSVALGGNFCYGLAAGYSSAAEFGMMADLGMSIAAYSVFGSILTIGAAIGAVLSGKIADFVGRKRNAWWVDIGRLSIGFAAGLNTFVVPMYIAEIAPKNIRGRFIAANHASIGHKEDFVGALQRLRGAKEDISQEATEIKLPAAILGVFLMDRFGRRPLLVVSCVASCLCMSTIGSSFYLQEHHYAKELTPSLVFLGILGFGYAFPIGMSGVPWVIMSEIFPLNVKASAGSLANLVSWSCCWLMTYAFNFMLQWSLAGTFFFFASMYVVAFLFVWMLVPETKGRSLEEIQATLLAPVPREF